MGRKVQKNAKGWGMDLGRERGAKGTSSNAHSLSLERWFSTEAGGDSLTTPRHLAVSGDN